MNNKSVFTVLTNVPWWAEYASDGIPISESNKNESDIKKKKERKPRKKNRKNSQLLYPLFLELKNLTTDLFWKTEFESMAYGKFPSKIQFNGTCLIYTNKKKQHIFEISNEDLNVVLTDLISFLNQKANIFSPSDSERLNLEMRNSILNSQIEEFTEWNQVKKKTNREYLIYSFVDKKSDLSSTEKSNMLRVINLGISASYFGNEEIKFKNGKIEKIKGLKRRENGEYYISEKLIKSKPAVSRSNVRHEESEVNSSNTLTTKAIAKSLSDHTTTKTMSVFSIWKRLLISTSKENKKYLSPSSNDNG